MSKALRERARHFLRWREATHGIPKIDLRHEGRNNENHRNVRNHRRSVESGIAEVDHAFRYNARTGRGDWR